MSGSSSKAQAVGNLQVRGKHVTKWDEVDSRSAPAGEHSLPPVLPLGGTFQLQETQQLAWQGSNVHELSESHDHDCQLPSAALQPAS